MFSNKTNHRAEVRDLWAASIIEDKIGKLWSCTHYSLISSLIFQILTIPSSNTEQINHTSQLKFNLAYIIVRKKRKKIHSVLIDNLDRKARRKNAQSYHVSDYSQIENSYHRTGVSNEDSTRERCRNSSCTYFPSNMILANSYTKLLVTVLHQAPGS